MSCCRRCCCPAGLVSRENGCSNPVIDLVDQTAGMVSDVSLLSDATVSLLAGVVFMDSGS